MMVGMARNRHFPGELPPKPIATRTAGAKQRARGCWVAYRMIAERENETYRFERESRLVIVAKAKVWASEGWRVVITDQDGKTFAPDEFDRLLAA
jgi:hypothetical protein